jgi:hypothetical protein
MRWGVTPMTNPMRILFALAAFLAFLWPAAAAQAQCNCALSSLIGDTVQTQAGNGPVLQSTVTNAVELPGAGPALGMAGPSPRMNIDYGSNTIRVDFIQQPATYGAGYVFKFTNLNPVPPQGCPGPAKITAISVQTNKANVPFVVSGATFGPNHVNVPFTGGSNVDWYPGEFILVRLEYGCDPVVTPTGGFDPCCPPWNATQLKSMLSYQGTNIGGPYTLKFTPTPQLHAQMNAYINYLQTLGMGFTTVSLKFDLIPGGTGSSWSGGAPSHTQTVTWPGLPNPNFFPPGVMQPNVWYRVRTTFLFPPPNANFLPEKCRETYIDIRLQLFPKPAGKSPGAARAPVLQYRLERGRITEEPLAATTQPSE